MALRNTMVSLITVTKAQSKLREHLKARRLQEGWTQAGLAKRSGVSLPTLRKFEQKGVISLESFLKLLLVLDNLDEVINAVKPKEKEFENIEEVLKEDPKKQRQKGWKT